MGDKTTVNLTVLNSQAEEARLLFNFEPDDELKEKETTWFQFSKVNYGELGFLPKLVEAGIAFDSCWYQGGNYGPGTKSLRFTDEGVAVYKEVYDSDVNPELYALLQLIDKPDELRQFILDHQEKVDSLPLDSLQLENSKLYRTLKLIGATPEPS